MEKRGLREKSERRSPGEPRRSNAAKRKKCEFDGQENIPPPTSKKRVRTTSYARPELFLKKSIIGFLMKEGAHCFDRSCADYIPEIIHGEREKEKEVHVDGSYLSRVNFGSNDKITAQNRLNALNQIANIHMVERSSSETIFLATSIFDRYLSQTITTLPKKHAMTLSFASFFIACKYDQYAFPLNYHLKQFSISLSDLLEMEKKILKALDWDLSVPTSLNFLRQYTKLNLMNDEPLVILSKYLLELCHRESSMLEYYPSKIAAAVLMVANKMLFPDREPWPSGIAEFTAYEESDLIPPAKAIIPILKKESIATPCTPVTKKYLRPAYANVVPFAFDSWILE